MSAFGGTNLRFHKLIDLRSLNLRSLRPIEGTT